MRKHLPFTSYKGGRLKCIHSLINIRGSATFLSHLRSTLQLEIDSHLYGNQTLYAYRKNGLLDYLKL